MKDQYVGDINDYAKYALCRALTATGDLTLGVWWMRTPNDGRPDGALTGYLRQPERWAGLDPELFVTMESLVTGEKRSLRHVEESGTLADASFWSAPMLTACQDRRCGFTEMLQRFRDRDLVLFDPDMGIEVYSVPPGHGRSGQYVYWDELVETYADGHSLLVFQYFPRVERQRFVARRLEQLTALVAPVTTCCVWTPRVAFFLAMHEHHRSLLEPRMAGFTRHWQLPVMTGGRVADSGG